MQTMFGHRELDDRRFQMQQSNLRLVVHVQSLCRTKRHESARKSIESIYKKIRR